MEGDKEGAIHASLLCIEEGTAAQWEGCTLAGRSGEPNRRLGGHRGVVVAAVCALAVVGAASIIRVPDDIDVRPDRVEQLRLEQHRILEHFCALVWSYFRSQKCTKK